VTGVNRGDTCKRRTTSYHLRGEVRNTRLANLTASEFYFRYFKEAKLPRDPLCGFAKKGMEEVRATKGPGDDWWNLTTGRIDVD
jgi:hypothetical protein